MIVKIIAVAAGALIVGVVVQLLRIVVDEYRRDRIPALLYHRIRRDSDEHAGRLDKEPVFVVLESDFRRQMEYLKEAGYTTITLDDYYAYRMGEKPLPEKPVLVTFDDGYRSNYEYAYPVLKELGQKATIFVTTDPNSHVFDPYREFDAHLTPEQIKEMSDSGVISIQSHGVTHRPLAELGEQEIEWELRESKRYLEELTGKQVNFLALAGAIYDKRPRRIAKQVGYLGVFTGFKGSMNGRSDMYCLRRLVVERDFTLEDFKRTLTPGYAVRWRIIGWIKSLASLLLGSSRAVRWREKIYASPIGRFITYKALAKILPVFIMLALAVLILAVLLEVMR